MRNKPRPALASLLCGTILIGCLAIISGCHPDAKAASVALDSSISPDSSANKMSPVVTNLNGPIANAATILARQEVPILCYHQIRDWLPSDSRSARDYIVPPAIFKEQIKSLADSGFHGITPDQLYEYLARGTQLPAKPVMITFDDTRVDQYNVAYPELSKNNFVGTYFIMTVSLGRPGYMSKEQVKEISEKGNTIGSHTWDHGNVKKYVGEDWAKQVDKPSLQLEKITGQPIKYFAYPFGLWNREAIVELKKRGFKAIFQLAAKQDPDDPLLSVRRIIVPGQWNGVAMQRVMRNSF